MSRACAHRENMRPNLIVAHADELRGNLFLTLDPSGQTLRGCNRLLKTGSLWRVPRRPHFAGAAFLETI